MPTYQYQIKKKLQVNNFGTINVLQTGYSFPLFSSLLKNRREESKEKEVAQPVFNQFFFIVPKCLTNLPPVFCVVHLVVVVAAPSIQCLVQIVKSNNIYF